MQNPPKSQFFVRARSVPYSRVRSDDRTKCNCAPRAQIRWLCISTVFGGCSGAHFSSTFARQNQGCAESRIPNPDTKAADSLPLRLSRFLILGIGIRAPKFSILFILRVRVRVILCYDVTLLCPHWYYSALQMLKENVHENIHLKSEVGNFSGKGHQYVCTYVEHIP